MVSYTTQVSLLFRKFNALVLTFFLSQVASKGWFVAMVATTVETANPEAEIQPGLNLLGPIKQKFLQVSDVFAPIDPGTESQLFISKSYDPTSHFETTCLVKTLIIIENILFREAIVFMNRPIMYHFTIL